MALDRVLADAFVPELPNYYKGKVRENYDLPDGRRIIIATDRLSAFETPDEHRFPGAGERRDQRGVALSHGDPGIAVAPRRPGGASSRAPAR